MPITSPFEILKNLDARFRRNSTGLPVAKTVVDDWIGIGFSINGVPLIAKMDEVSEILPPPDTIRVPGVVPWVNGLANIRGNLMPVLDMNAFLYGKPTDVRKESRILIINKLGVVAGLLVDEVYGLRRFKPEEHQEEIQQDAGSLVEYLAGTFVDQVRRWNVFSVERLTKAEQFLRVV
ncbi:MAG: purine-binding chemotaxis protein CheW [Gammaproteobacteria bacterium]|nr:MAG: purine-binding chemotaxis protein CheW [Gammaproteobacteria bacterium]UCH41850.1 MAG: purine-binding chemotaxis protein CheW [Gammaproteobacteria bacterium]